MNNDFGIDLEFFSNNTEECTQLLAGYLNKGHLGLLLGAGASKALDLPDWDALVRVIATEIEPGLITKSKKKKYFGHELKDLMQKVKRKINNNEVYLETVRKHLYDGVNFDFSLARKDLLIALSALMIGKRRGNVQDVVTFNFDSVLEWYLKTLGLHVNTTNMDDLLIQATDVNVTHTHGYLPNPESSDEKSDFLIFSREEFQQRMLDVSNYWKENFYDFFRRHIFLSIGLSVDSLINDVCPYLTQTNKWYEREKVNRLYPYGIAFLSPANTSQDDFPVLLENGIIPCVLSNHGDVPTAIFKIVQEASLTFNEQE